MINTAFLTDSIDILQEWEELVCNEWVSNLSEIHSWVPASLGCMKWAVDIFSCWARKVENQEGCVEIAPEIELACFNKDIIIRIYRYGCDIWLYRVERIQPVKFISQDELYSYHMYVTQISDNKK